MGYESKLIIAKGFNDKNDGTGYHSKVVTIDMCRMGGDDWFSLFSKVFPGEVYIEDENKPTTEDKYGDRLTYATVREVYNWCQSHHNDKTGFVYWRQSVLEAMLKEIILSGNDRDLLVIHYGH